MRGSTPQHLDWQLAKFSQRLCDEVGLTPEESASVATHITGDVKRLPDSTRQLIRNLSPIKPRQRTEELSSFEIWKEHSVTKKHGGAPSHISPKAVEATA